MESTYRKDLEKEIITINGEDYVPMERVNEILDEIEDELRAIPDLLRRLY